MPLIAAHGSSNPRGLAGIVRLLVGILRLAVWVTSGAVGVYEAACRPAAAAFGDGPVGQGLFLFCSLADVFRLHLGGRAPALFTGPLSDQRQDSVWVFADTSAGGGNVGGSV